jgi:hypothetical protein
MNMPTESVLMENGPKGLLDIAPTDTAVIINMSALELTLFTHTHTHPWSIIKDCPPFAKLELGGFLTSEPEKLGWTAIVTSKLHW